MKLLVTTAAAALLSTVSMGAAAALHERGNGMVYDDDLNITWLKDWNTAKTAGLSQTGALTWEEAVAWADGLSVGGYSDWRLPRLTALGDPDCNDAPSICGGSLPAKRDRLDYSELSHVWYITLGGKPIVSPITGEVNQDWRLSRDGLPFDNVPVHANYWLGNRYMNMNTWAWMFNESGGEGYGLTWLTAVHAVAVRDGDVTLAVPEPATCLLWAIGLGVLVGTRACRKPIKLPGIPIAAAN